MPVKPEEGKWERLPPALGWMVVADYPRGILHELLKILGDDVEAKVSGEKATLREAGVGVQGGVQGQDDRTQQISWHALAGRKYHTALAATGALTFGLRYTCLMVVLEEVRSLTRFFLTHFERGP